MLLLTDQILKQFDFCEVNYMLLSNTLKSTLSLKKASVMNAESLNTLAAMGDGVSPLLPFVDPLLGYAFTSMISVVDDEAFAAELVDPNKNIDYVIPFIRYKYVGLHNNGIPVTVYYLLDQDTQDILYEFKTDDVETLTMECESKTTYVRKVLGGKLKPLLTAKTCVYCKYKTQCTKKPTVELMSLNPMCELV